MVTAKSIAKAARQYQRKSRKDRRTYGRIWPDGSASLSWPQERREETDPLSNSELRLPDNGASALNLVHCSDLSQEQCDIYQAPRSRALPYGAKGMSGYGKKVVRSAGVLLQRRFGKRNLTMLTMTVPPLSESARKEVARNWGELERQLLQYLGRCLTQARQPKLVVLVSEIQTARLSETGEAYLHFHAVFPARRKGRKGWAVCAYKLRRWWWSALNRVTCGQCTQQPRVETALVKKDAAGYLAKYLSKGQGDIREMIKDVGGDCIPRRWWSVTRPLLAMVKKAILEGPNVGEVLQGLQIILELSDYKLDYCTAHPIMIDAGGDSRLVAWAYKLWGPLLEDLTSLLKSDCHGQG